jgi:hypothetical protein
MEKFHECQKSQGVLLLFKSHIRRYSFAYIYGYTQAQQSARICELKRSFVEKASAAPPSSRKLEWHAHAAHMNEYVHVSVPVAGLDSHREQFWRLQEP